MQDPEDTELLCKRKKTNLDLLTGVLPQSSKPAFWRGELRDALSPKVCTKLAEGNALGPNPPHAPERQPAHEQPCRGGRRGNETQLLV
jgi:hypothetical protein